MEKGITVHSKHKVKQGNHNRILKHVLFVPWLLKHSPKTHEVKTYIQQDNKIRTRKEPTNEMRLTVRHNTKTRNNTFHIQHNNITQ